jgi:hypothetical protein
MNGRHVEGAKDPLIVKLAEVRNRSNSKELGTTYQAENGHQSVHSFLEESRINAHTSPAFFRSENNCLVEPYSSRDFKSYKCVHQLSSSYWINNAAIFSAETHTPFSTFWPMPSLPASATANLKSEGTRTIGVVLQRRDTACNVMSLLWDTLTQFGEVIGMSVDTTGIYPPPPAGGALVLVQMKSQPQALAAARALNGSLLMSCCGPVSMQVAYYSYILTLLI